MATAAAAQAQAAANTAAAAVVAATTAAATQPTAVKASRPAADQPTEKKRGPGRPPGSTKQSIEQQRLLQQQNGSKFSSYLSNAIYFWKYSLNCINYGIKFEEGAPAADNVISCHNLT